MHPLIGLMVSFYAIGALLFGIAFTAHHLRGELAYSGRWPGWVSVPGNLIKFTLLWPWPALVTAVAMAKEAKAARRTKE